MSRAEDVIAGVRRWSCEASPALLFLRRLPDRCVSLVFFSPHYERQRTYGVGIKSRGQAWVDELRAIVAEASRVSNGLVVVNAAGPVESRSYSPSMEWLVADLTRLDGLVCGPAPWCWDKVCGIPGSGGEEYQRRDWEPLYSFCRPDRLPLAWSDNTAFGKPPVCGPGGAFSNRSKDGGRVNATVRLKKPRAAVDVIDERDYEPPEIANPGNIIRARVGGNHIGSRLAHHNEAPMSLEVAERFVCWYVPPDGIALDCFSGSGTTCHAALLHGRRFVGCDLRESQVRLCERRVKTVTPNLLPA